jgi:hypothetical protein
VWAHPPRLVDSSTFHFVFGWVTEKFITMAPSLKLLVVAVAASVASGFSPSSTFGVRQSTQLQESFGFGFAEDTYENQPDLLKGEGEYKQYANRIKSDNMLNRKVRD